MTGSVADAVVIGSGPGGATAAEVLTSARWSVVIVEKGRDHLFAQRGTEREEGDGESLQLASDYSNDEIKFACRHFLGPDPLIEPRTFRTGAEDGERLHVGEVNSIPSTVGGGGVHADGKVPRFREEDFALLSTYGPLGGAAVEDWPLSYEDLEPFYAEAERAVGVAGDASANPFAAWRSGPYPMPPGAPMYGAILSSAAAERIGLHPYAAPTAVNSVPYDGRPACNNCGFCASFGCPIHAKGDPVAMLRRALDSGNAELLSESFVSRIRTDGRRATGVEVVGPDGATRTIGARHVVVAAGAIETPRLLMLSGLGGPATGRHLMVHFQTFAVGILPERLHAHRGRAVTHVHDDAVLVDSEARRAAKEAGLAWVRGGMVEHGGPSLPIAEAKNYPWGEMHQTLMQSSPLRDRMWAFTMQGEDLPQPSNRVDLDPGVRDVRGFPVARVTYRPHRHELVASAHHGRKLVRLLEEMGATWTRIATSPAVAADSGAAANAGGGGYGSPVPQSRHVMGTTRMGSDPSTSVVDPYGRLHELDNVVVADSSVFVTSSGYGPTLTLVALAARAAAAMAGR
ncbi:MAG TPA: GMC family oxidoreductase [Acidimicrobiales bacterium]|nr:GMC family oxidoreductase [Acidimicrobiales bacterium]